MTITVSDALSRYSSVLEANHRFWAYFQALALGTAAFAWTRDPLERELALLLTAAFLAFAVLNARLVFLSQRDARRLAAAIRKYAKNKGDGVPRELRAVARLHPDKPASVLLWHLSLTAAAVGTVWWRYFS